MGLTEAILMAARSALVSFFIIRRWAKTWIYETKKKKKRLELVLHVAHALRA